MRNFKIRAEGISLRAILHDAQSKDGEAALVIHVILKSREALGMFALLSTNHHNSTRRSLLKQRNGLEMRRLLPYRMLHNRREERPSCNDVKPRENQTQTQVFPCF